MSFLDRLDPELAALFVPPPAGGALEFTDLKATRAMANRMLLDVAAQFAPIEGVTSEDHMVAGPPGDPAVRVRLYAQTDRPERLPGLLWMHGGGYVFGNIEFDDVTMKQLARTVGCVVASVEYRLAPENPFPAPIEDCYAALRWMAAHADSLGVEPSRIAVGGPSAGGGLAAALALLARDRAEVEVAFQLLIQPMIDDRNVTPSSHAITDRRTWHRESNIICWGAYLGQARDAHEVSPYAAASRATRLAGLPPAHISVGELDLFLDEDIEYAQRLMQAGVSTELHVYPGAPHGFEVFAPNASVTRRFLAERDYAIKQALHR